MMRRNDNSRLHESFKRLDSADEMSSKIRSQGGRYMTRLFFILIWVSILFPLLSLIWAQEYSELWGATGEKWSSTSRLPDFSFAGYHSGEKPISTIPPTANVKSYGAKGDGHNTRIPSPFWMLLLLPLMERS